MKISFNHSFSEKTPEAMVLRSVCGQVQSIIYEEKIFNNQTDAIFDKLIFVVGGVEFDLTKCNKVYVISGEKEYTLEKSELTKHYQLNGTDYTSLKELYFALEDMHAKEN